VILAEVLTAPPTLGPGRLLCLDGPTGAGKTTLATRLAAQARDASVDVAVVHLDDLCEGWTGLDHVGERVRDLLLTPLAEARPGRYRRWDWVASGWDEWVTVAPVDLLVLEGVGSGCLEVAPFITSLVWLDAPYDVRKARALARDGEAFAPHWQAWAESETAHFARHRTRERADVQVS
jgi:energy-coupling factor transporter ATP-binding protein EcfA2